MKIPWLKRKCVPQLLAGELHAWLTPFADDRLQWSEHWTRLSDAERKRAEQFQLDEPRLRFVITRAALRTLLGQYSGIAPEEVSLEFGFHGKPRLVAEQAARGLSFNVAHSGDFALIGVTLGCEIGVDIERLRPVNHAEHIARRYFHPTEIEAILAAPPAVRDATFLRCWTGKEAVLKALGSGITGSLAEFLVPVEPYESAWIELPPTLANEPKRCWLRALEPCEGYLGAVACLGGERDVQCFAFAV